MQNMKNDYTKKKRHRGHSHLLRRCLDAKFLPHLPAERSLESLSVPLWPRNPQQFVMLCASKNVKRSMALSWDLEQARDHDDLTKLDCRLTCFATPARSASHFEPSILPAACLVRRLPRHTPSPPRTMSKEPLHTSIEAVAPHCRLIPDSAAQYDSSPPSRVITVKPSPPPTVEEIHRKQQ